MNGGYHGHLMSKLISQGENLIDNGYSNFMYEINLSEYPSSNAKLSIKYNDKYYTLNGNKYTLEDSPNYFILGENGLFSFVTPTEKREFEKIPNSSAWGLKSLIRTDGYEVRYEKDYEEYKLGKNQYFMLGDNSAHSLDSRYWGPVPRKNLMGTAMVVFWPFSHRWGLPDKYEPIDKKTVIKGKF
jgi:signal peptidase I